MTETLKSPELTGDARSAKVHVHDGTERRPIVSVTLSGRAHDGRTVNRSERLGGAPLTCKVDDYGGDHRSASNGQQPREDEFGNKRDSSSNDRPKPWLQAKSVSQIANRDRNGYRHVAAANGLLDRGHGKATQHIEANVNIYDSLSLADKQALLAALDALDGDEESDSGEPEPTHH